MKKSDENTPQKSPTYDRSAQSNVLAQFCDCIYPSQKPKSTRQDGLL